MQCLKCGGEITDLNDVLDDGAGIQVRMHRACAVAGATTPDDLDRPDYQEAKATGRFAPGQLTDGNKLIHITPDFPQVARKADVPMFSTDQCALCHRPVSGVDVVRSQAHVAHKACVQTLLAFINEPEEPHDTKQVVKAVGGEDEDRLAREDARFLLRTLADMVRAQEAD